jgi:DNA-binding PucR family transcriptional regulator
MNSLRHGSAVAQLENDQLDEKHVDPIEAAWRTGFNRAVQCALYDIRHNRQPSLEFAREHEPESTETTRAWARGFNAAIRHVKDVLRTEAALRELADAPCIATVDLGEEKP